MARTRAIARDEGDEDEAAALISVPLMPNNSRTPFEQATLDRQAREAAEHAASEKVRLAHFRKTMGDLKATQSVLAGKVAALIRDEYKNDPRREDIVTMMMRGIEPILAAGKEGGRRERGRLFMVPPKAPTP